MRTAYHEELARFGARLGDLARLAETALGQATSALLDNDLSLARKVTADEGAITKLHHLLDAEAVTLLARQQPVAGELRTIVAGLRMSSDLDRMGAMARHVAELVELRHPDPVVPETLQPTVATMGEVARRMAARARQAMAAGDATALTRIARDDDEMDHLEAMLRRQVTHGDPRPSLDTAMDLALLGRYYQRFGDHA
ncbi:phosphate signaling complex protein PhoU, partial [Amycolatopsis rhizosphaerae]